MSNIATITAKNRNSYIDVIKFCFAIIIMCFHTGVFFHGGRVAVEGFFMVSGYLMMVKIHNSSFKDDPVGFATIRFIGHKLMALIPYILSSSLIGLILLSVQNSYTLVFFLKKLVGLVFEVFVLQSAGFQGTYTSGISWYLSALFLSLTILYPFCYKYTSNFVLTACPISSLLIYGFFSHQFGHLAVGTTYIDGLYINPGLLRGLAGCSVGCLLYENVKYLSKINISKQGLFIISILECFGWCALVFFMNQYPKTYYDYLCVFILYGLLAIGISGLSIFSRSIKNINIKFLGTASMLIPMNHYYQNTFLVHKYGKDYIRTDKILLFILCVVLSCIIAWLFGKLITHSLHKLQHYIVAK